MKQFIIWPILVPALAVSVSSCCCGHSCHDNVTTPTCYTSPCGSELDVPGTLTEQPCGDCMYGDESYPWNPR